MGNKILVLVDGSERTIQTVNYVKDFMPTDENMKIVLFHVFSGIPEQYRDLEAYLNCANPSEQLKNIEIEEKKKIVDCLEESKKILISGGFAEQSIEVKFHSLEKGVARDIIEEAKDGYTAVVMRRRGMGAFRNIILGSVAVKLLQSLTFIPIIIVGQMPPAKKVLLAVDSSEDSMKAVNFVASFLKNSECEVTITHVIPGLGAINFDLTELNMLTLPDVSISESCIEAFRFNVAKLFKDVKKILVTSGFKPEKITEKIISGVLSRADAIVNEAQHGEYSTIVVGRRGLSKVEAFFMGRVGHEVVYGGKKFTVWVV
ncbi:MAG: universal stress protein [Desulfamplus sp.]|nr:universal stress protein [Desulfamplus sp.]